MKGSPGFIGERLKQAREARGLTAISLSELIGISRQAISMYESGEVTPQPDMLYLIAEKLNMPVPFFITPIDATNTKPVFFRSLSAATKMDRSRGNTRIEWLADFIIPYLRKMLSFPNVNIPYMHSFNFLSAESDDIERIATNVRKYWGLGDGPISNIVLLLENNGIMIVRTNLSSTALDAFSTWHSRDNMPYIILGTDKGSPTRSRFDAAHELGHLILHKNVDQTKINSSQIFNLIEDQANRFASAFLVPAASYANDYTTPNLDALLLLKERWRVSVAMQIMRISDLGFIPDEYARRMWINYNRRGWKRSEPREDKIPLEKPVLLERACRLIIKERIKTTEDILGDIPLSQKDIEELLNLEFGYLKPSSPLVTLIDSPTSQNEYNEALEEVNNILKNPPRKN